MPPFPPGRPIACCTDVPAPRVAPARHGLEVLLTGLGLEPHWVDVEGLADGGIYYGDAPDAAPAAGVRFRAAPAPAGPIDAAGASRLDWAGGAWPLLSPPGRTFGAPSGAAEEADVVASTHAWTSGLLEAAVVRRDTHGRLRDEDAAPAVVAAMRPDLADPSLRPPVDAYRAWIGAALERAGAPVPGRSWVGHRWAVIPTVDVDMVRTRRPGALLGDDPRRERLAELMALVACEESRATVFLKAGATAQFDVAYALDHAALDPVWAAAGAGRAELALHPSYFAHDHVPRLAAERIALADAARAAGATVSPLVRTHFLRWVEPGTPRALVAAGFAVDSSLGYAGRAGFRRGTAVPFRLYDLDAGAPIDAWEVPLAAMDTALWTHARAGRTGAAASVNAVLAGAREAGGAAVLLWHNEPVAEGHVDVLETALNEARAAGALVDGIAGALAGWRAGS